MNKRKHKRLGIKAKVAIASVVPITVLVVAIVLVGYRLFEFEVTEHYEKYAATVLDYAYSVTGDYPFGDMIAAREMPDGYEDMRADLNRVKENSDIEYLYAVYFEDVDDIHSLTYAINAKTSEEMANGGSYTYLGTPCEEGSFEDDTLLILQEAVKTGKKDSGVLRGNSEEYGHMLNGYKVIFDSKGNPVGLLCVEIDINDIQIDMARYVRMIVILAVAITAIVIVVYVFNTDRMLIKPLTEISDSTNAFVLKMQDNTKPEDLVYDAVEVKTGDEIEFLADDIKSMSDSVKEYMINLRNITSEKERLGAELNVATKIQEGILPREFPPYPDRNEFELYASMKPAREVGGDLYDFFLLDDDHIALVIADVSGKGIPAALFMMVSKLLIKNRTKQDWTSTSAILSEVNDQLCERNKMEMFVTVWLAVIDLKTGKGIASNCGHEHPAIRHADGGFELLKYRHSPALGTMHGIKTEEHEFELKPGDCLFIYTDGVPEATNAENEFWGVDRMIAALNTADVTMADSVPESVIRSVSASLDAYVAGAEQFDDVTMLCFEYKG